VPSSSVDLPAAPVELTDRSAQWPGSRLARGVLRLLGWKLQWNGLPGRQGVIVVYPHTSNWDFVFAMLAKWGAGFPVTFWGKDTLFRVPLFGRWLRYLGGIPVDRASSRGVVAQMADRLRQARGDGSTMWLALSPEGTRSRVDGWRSGFYQVAMQARVPVCLAYLDYARREVGFDSCWMLSGDRERDIACIAARLGHRRGRRPELGSEIRFK